MVEWARLDGGSGDWVVCRRLSSSLDDEPGGQGKERVTRLGRNDRSEEQEEVQRLIKFGAAATRVKGIGGSGGQARRQMPEYQRIYASNQTGLCWKEDLAALATSQSRFIWAAKTPSREEGYGL